MQVRTKMLNGCTKPDRIRIMQSLKNSWDRCIRSVAQSIFVASLLRAVGSRPLLAVAKDSSIADGNYWVSAFRRKIFSRISWKTNGAAADPVTGLVLSLYTKSVPVTFTSQLVVSIFGLSTSGLFTVWNFYYRYREWFELASWDCRR